MAYPKKWDWQAIRLEYIAGEITTDEFGNEVRKHYSVKRLAEKHNIPQTTLQKKCFEEKWIQDRRRLDVQLKRKVTEDTVTQLFGESVISSSYTLKQLGKINVIIDAYLQPYIDLLDPEKNQSISVKTTINEDGYSNLEVLSEADEKKINPRDIKDIVSIIKEVHTLTKSILGDETLQVAIEDIKVKDKAKSISKLKGSNAVLSQIEKLQKEKEKIQAKLSSSNELTLGDNESNTQELEDEDDE
jgi:hypothetical protein